ncbi:hypothetical protein LTS12_023368 [Elasticomyces elasticus]|nr:hypothetical protein LTS12_023368 [Elasticomyces elasticus]
MTSSKIDEDKTISVDVAPTITREGEKFLLARNGNVIDNGLQRGLESRHLVMISLGGVVGASIWYACGTAVSYSGPVGALICFFIIGVDVFFVMQCLGEISTLFPVQGAFMELTGRFVDESLAFSLGWNYWYLWVTSHLGRQTLMSPKDGYNSGSIIMSYWTQSVPSYGWILIWWAFYQFITLLGVVVWAEMEFWLACWKLLCILGGFLYTGAIGGQYIGFRYWKNPGPIANGIDGFGQSFLLAAVYYCGTEMLAITAAESKNPTRDLPEAIKNTFWRILIIFMGLVFFAGILVPFDDPDLLSATSKSGKSPWTIAFTHAGVPGMGHVVNVVLITAQLSGMNSALYVTSRTLVSLASTGRAPKLLAKTSKNGTPIYALIFSNALGLISMLNYSVGSGKVFNYLVTISGSATYIAWAVIGVVHYRFRKAWKAQGNRTEDLPFEAMLYPYGTLFVIFLNTFLVFIAGYSAFVGEFQPVNFVINYIVIAVFTVLYLGWKIIKSTKIVPLLEVDLVTGRREWLAQHAEMGHEEEKKVPWYTQVKRLIFA